MKKTRIKALRKLGNMLDNFGNSYNPSNLLNYKTGNPVGSGANAGKISSAMPGQDVTVSSLDTFNTQEGNIYDFGGYWNYNLGNSYAEDHINQSAILNLKHTMDWSNAQLVSEVFSGDVFTADDTSAVASGNMGTLSSEFAVGSVIGTVVIPGLMGIVGPNVASKGGVMLGAAVAGGVASIGAIVANLLIFESDIWAARLPSDNIGDVIAGPGSGDIKTWADKVGSSFDGTTQTAPSLKKKRDRYAGKNMPFGLFHYLGNSDRASPMHTDTTWVEKTFGDSYSFSQGNSIDITHGNSEEHVKGDQYEYKYGGVRESMNFTGGGVRTAWEKTGHGQAQEVHWDSLTGQLVSYEYKVFGGHLTFSVTMPTLPKLAINVSLSTLNTSIDLSAGTSMSFKAAASLAMNVNLTAGFSIDFERSVGGKIVNDETTNGFEFKAVGMRAHKEAEMKAGKKNLELLKTMTNIASGEIKMEHGKMKVGKRGMYMELSDFKFF